VRRAYLDNLKVVLVAGIIAGHAVLGYSDFGSWTYQAYHEVKISSVTEVALLAVMGPFALFMIALLFLVAGLLTPASLERKGTLPFVRARLLRLGTPFALYALVLWPGVVHLLDRGLTGSRASYWYDFAHQEPLLDTGPLWFLLVLLIFSGGYALWRDRRPGRAHGAPVTPLRGRHLAALAAAVMVKTYAVRLEFGFDSAQVAGLHLWQWPECVALFGLGTLAAQRGWLEQVPRGLRRGCGRAVLVTVGLTGAFVVAAAPLGVTDEQLGGGLAWPALAVAAIEGTLTVCGSVWLLATAQRRLTADGPGWRLAGRSAYSAFLLQGPVLLGLAVAMRPVGVPAEVKALVVALAGVGACFALGWLLVRRTWLGRIL
jgi:hypothetical protein